jgi:Putative Ig domain
MPHVARAAHSPRSIEDRIFVGKPQVATVQTEPAPRLDPVRQILSFACVAILAALLLAGSPAGADALTWPAASQVTSAVSLQTGAIDPTLNSTACWSSGSCVSVGEDDASGGEHPIVVTDINGAAAQAVVVTVPRGASTGVNATASLNSVSCSSAGACVAVGEYQDTSGTMHGLVVPISAGKVGRASGVTGPGASGQTYLRAVSCPQVGICVAVGTYGINANANQDGVIVTITNGSASSISAAGLPTNANTSAPLVSINSVSCWGSGYCVAAGQYLANSNGGIYPFVIPISNGLQAAGIEVVLPVDAYTGTGGQQSVLNSVSCQATGVCVAAGAYVNSSGGSRPLVVPITIAGAPTAAAPVALPANAAGPTYNDGLNSVSCSPTGACVAVGHYVDSSGSGEPLAVSTSGRVVSAATELALPSNALALTGGLQAASLSDVACPQSGSCLAVGEYYDSAANQQGMVEAISGRSSTSNEALLPAPLVDPGAALKAVGCATSASCVAVGTYTDTTAQPQAFQYSLEAGLTIADPRLPKAYVGTTYTTTVPASGAWNAYKWSVASGRLPAGLSLNPRTGKISGKPRTASTRKFKIRVAATGNPAQTVTKALSITVVPRPALSVSIPRSGLKLSGKSLSLRVRCAKGARCRGLLNLVYVHEVQLKQRKRREGTVIGQLYYVLGASRSRTVKIVPTSVGLQFLNAATGHKLAVALDATVIGGKSSSKHTTLGVAPIAKKKKKRP